MLQNHLHSARNFFLPEQKAFDRICVLTSLILGFSKCGQFNSIFFFLPRSCAVWCLVTQSCATFCDPMDCSLPRKNTRVGCHALLQGIYPIQRLNSGLPSLQTDSLPSEPPGKTKNTGVGSLSLLKGKFQTQELNQGLLN